MKKILPLSSKLQIMMGSIKLPKKFDYKKEIGKALTKKYIKLK
jgi:hypothetical protein